jgi:hypothetical protein
MPIFVVTVALDSELIQLESLGSLVLVRRVFSCFGLYQSGIEILSKRPII